MMHRGCVVLLTLFVWTPWAWAEGGVALPGATFEVRDTLAPEAEPRAEARQMLDRVLWEPEAFEVSFQQAPSWAQTLGTLVYPSPLPTGRANQDRVCLDWYAARDAGGVVTEAPAVLLIHSLHPELVMARMMARSLAAQGVHAFVMELPGYGRRIDEPRRHTGVTALIHANQGVADARRARDVIASLAAVKEDAVSIEGTSLGGFFATATASLDDAFANVFLFLCGGDCFDVLMNGQKDATRVRQSMAQAGYTNEKLRALLDPIEPMRVAHRLDSERTYLYTARGDMVVPPENSRRLASVIGLENDHFVQFDGNHYSALLLLPSVIDRMVTAMSAAPSS